MGRKVKVVLFFASMLFMMLIVKGNVVSADEGPWVEKSMGYVPMGSYVHLDDPVTENSTNITGYVSANYGEDRKGFYVHLYASGGQLISTAITETDEGRFDLRLHTKLIGTDAFTIVVKDHLDALSTVRGIEGNLRGEVRVDDPNFFQSDTYHQIKVELPVKVSKDMVRVRASRYVFYGSSVRFSLYVNGQLIAENTYPYFDENIMGSDILYTGMQVATFNIKNTPVKIKKGDVYKITEGSIYGSREDDEEYVMGFVRE
ncbi:hypothetical protein [Listeria rustica]|uniref:Uncharacterized protein n=1 Tax=Listeria rustica TaxID=2713503 RepID=A0A7W1YFW4_9LIST|nr:hypothetical protein [Listeria rustica]MBA3926130.1 hypothetical protein [Listeria rustica]